MNQTTSVQILIWIFNHCQVPSASTQLWRYKQLKTSETTQHRILDLDTKPIIWHLKLSWMVLYKTICKEKCLEKGLDLEVVGSFGVQMPQSFRRASCIAGHLETSFEVAATEEPDLNILLSRFSVADGEQNTTFIVKKMRQILLQTDARPWTQLIKRIERQVR